MKAKKERKKREGDRENEREQENRKQRKVGPLCGHRLYLFPARCCHCVLSSSLMQSLYLYASVRGSPNHFIPYCYFNPYALAPLLSTRGHFSPPVGSLSALYQRHISARDGQPDCFMNSPMPVSQAERVSESESTLEVRWRKPELRESYASRLL